ncbi:hypothetical protein ZIOFF_047700 [Zingiber officinale]|uniref:Uncharacterized protein n=1 Tax=Zingiber officinale TaxID=94328 RepID=A0A8J5FTN8_ZINOF|nr:hypothetical protein ZIOFF_047700 [Zingiber officinale]
MVGGGLDGAIDACGFPEATAGDPVRSDAVPVLPPSPAEEVPLLLPRRDHELCTPITIYLIKLCHDQSNQNHIQPQNSVANTNRFYLYHFSSLVGGKRRPASGWSSGEAVVDWVYDNFDKYYDLVTPDTSLVSPETDANPKTKEIAKKMIIMGLWCIQIKPENRPSISMVINMLEGSIMDLQMPPKPEFS